MYEIPKNVSDFLFRAADAYGSYKSDEFSQFMWSECKDISSPIEQLFFVAIHLVAEMNFIALGVAQSSFSDENDDLLIIPQWKVGKYKVDFALRQHPIDRIVCVELDGHEFHDRDERQRRYEKSRDRFLTASGFSALHFTGSEVVKDPCAVAIEAFRLATGQKDVSHPFEDI